MRGSVNIPHDLQALDRRDWQLWGISFVIIATLTVGILLLHYSLPNRSAGWERTVLYGQGVLIVLTLAYFVQKRTELIRVRLRLIQEKLQSENLRDRYDALGNTLAFTTRVGVLKDEQRILQYAAEQTLTTLRADHCLIGLQNENDTLPPTLRSHLAREGVTDHEACTETWTAVSRWILSHDTSLLISDQTRTPQARDLIRTDGLREVIAAPVRLGSRVAGALVVAIDPASDAMRRRFGQYDRRLVEIMANATSAAIDNGRLASRLKRRRDQLRKSLKRLRMAQPGVILGERLKAMEELVDKVAHYISNPLTTISGYAQLLGTQDLDQDVKRCLGTISEEVERCNQAINDLKAFAHRPPSEPRSTDLNQLLNQALFLKAYRFNRMALEVDFEPDDDVGLVILDPVQVQQAFLNVLTDIENALADTRNQHLTVQTQSGDRNVRIHFVVRNHEPRDPNETTMPAWIPFSPNGEKGDETSLARDIMHAVIRGHGGQTLLNLDPENRSTVFTIDLPRILEQPKDPMATTPPPPSLTGSADGRSVLIVDDEERILNLFQRVLAKEGYVVTTALSGQAGLELVTDRDFDAIIVDYHIPDLNGRAIAEHIVHNRPELVQRLILTSGDDEADDFKALAREARAVTLAKPFQIHEMLEMVNHVVHRTQVPS